jgi:antitoxin VapB
MGLNIKNEHTHQLVRELATLQGVSQVAAITQAVEEKLQREKARRAPGTNQGLAEWLMEISRETAPLMNDGRTTKELFDELYDEDGLPK